MIRVTLTILVLLVQVVPAQAQQQAQELAHAYFERLTALCGSRYVGAMTFPVDGQDTFKGKTLVAEFKECSEQQVRIPFAVGDDTSRTWVFTKTEQGVILQHDHRHADGSADEVTNYGGESDGFGDALTQSFPADIYTRELIPVASTNIWSVTLSEDGEQLTYHLERHNTPRFTAVLHLSAD